MMTEIFIKDTDIKKICGINSFFMENEITAPENFNFTAKGNFDSECLEQLTEYLLENNYILGCFTFNLIPRFSTYLTISGPLPIFLTIALASAYMI